MAEFLTAAEVGHKLDVSRETLQRLETYVELLLKWQRAINLIGPGTVEDVWRRHILDCGQLKRYLPDLSGESSGPVIDLGSGAGLPGMVLAIMGVPDVRLIESDSRKCVFLREAARQTGSSVKIIEGRAESIEKLTAHVITARALAPLSRLLELSEPFIESTTLCIFSKGRGLKNELTEIKNKWTMKSEIHPSETNPDGAIVKLESVIRVDASHDRS